MTRPRLTTQLGCRARSAQRGGRRGGRRAGRRDRPAAHRRPRPKPGRRQYAALGIVDDQRRIERFITSGISAEERRRLGPLPEGHGLLVEIHDNGRGFEPLATPLHGHYGLANMHDRAKALHGDLVVESGPGAGTRIIVRIPVAEYGERAKADD